jgi:hypothetical protein
VTEEPKKLGPDKAQRADKTGEVPSPSKPSQEQSGRDIWQRDPKAKTPLPDFFHGELMTIYKRLGRLCRRERETSRLKRLFLHDWDRFWGGLALLFTGALLAGLFGLIPFLASDPGHRTRWEYYGALIGAGALAALSVVGRMSVRQVSGESVFGIYDFVGDILQTYTPTEEPRPPQESG